MFQRIQQYEPIQIEGTWYRPRAFADPQLDGAWDGWLIFFHFANRSAIAPSAPETTTGSLEALVIWAAGVTYVELQDALVRALKLGRRPNVLAQLEDAEYDAVAAAERLRTTAAVERTAAALDEVAAKEARADAAVLRRERAATEVALAAEEERAATLEANLHETAAQGARAVAGDAARRRDAAQEEATQRTPTKRRRARTPSKPVSATNKKK